MDASVERRKREAGVRRGRLQVKVMEIIRKVERARRNTEGLMDRNAALGKLLEDIEKGKPENLKDNEAEKARRGEVVKIMKLELKVMERESLNICQYVHIDNPN